MVDDPSSVCTPDWHETVSDSVVVGVQLTETSVGPSAVKLKVAAVSWGCWRDP